MTYIFKSNKSETPLYFKKYQETLLKAIEKDKKRFAITVQELQMLDTDKTIIRNMKILNADGVEYLEFLSRRLGIEVEVTEVAPPIEIIQRALDKVGLGDCCIYEYGDMSVYKSDYFKELFPRDFVDTKEGICLVDSEERKIYAGIQDVVTFLSEASVLPMIELDDLIILDDYINQNYVEGKTRIFDFKNAYNKKYTEYISDPLTVASDSLIWEALTKSSEGNYIFYAEDFDQLGVEDIDSLVETMRLDDCIVDLQYNQEEKEVDIIVDYLKCFNLEGDSLSESEWSQYNEVRTYWNRNFSGILNTIHKDSPSNIKKRYCDVSFKTVERELELSRGKKKDKGFEL